MSPSSLVAPRGTVLHYRFNYYNMDVYIYTSMIARSTHICLPTQAHRTTPEVRRLGSVYDVISALFARCLLVGHVGMPLHLSLLLVILLFAAHLKIVTFN